MTIVMERRMSKRTPFLVVAISAVLLSIPLTAMAGDILDARIDFPFADDNILRDAGEDRQSSPDASFTPPAGLDYQSFVHLGIYKKLDLGGNFIPEAALYLKLDVAESGGIRDDSSYIRLNYFVDGEARRKNLYLQLLPIDADRERLGFHYEVSWGGTDIFPRNFRGSLAPGARFGYESDHFYAYAGAKTALVRSASASELDNEEGNTTLFVERTFYGLLAGFGVELGVEGLWFEANGGFFEKGTNNKSEVLGKSIHAGGGSAQLSYSFGQPVHRRIDLGLYLQDPNRFDVTRAIVPSTTTSGRIAAEYTYLMQTLADLDAPGSTKNEASMAGFFSTGLQFGGLRLHLDASMRDLTFITYDVPGFIPNASLPEGADVSPEYAGVFSIDYTFEESQLTPFGQVKVQVPAIFNGVAPAGQNAPDSIQGQQTVVVRGSDPGDWDILPEGEDAGLVFSAKAGLKWTYGDTFSLLAEVNYAHDPNRALLRKDENGIAHRVFVDPSMLGFGILASMRY